MNKERSSVLSLAAILAFRMLGLFMIFPVFATEAPKLYHASAFLVGFAVAIYGLVQALLQLPFGMLSDRLGRKPILITGLALFAAGSIIAASSHSIYGIIIGRALQGAGAIGSTILATIADLTRDESRSKAMAMVGLNIGMAFSLALILGPFVNAYFGLPGIFWLTAVLSFVGILMVIFAVPKLPTLVSHPEIEAEPGKFASVIKNCQLLRLDFGIFSLQAILTALFLAVPVLFVHKIQLSNLQQSLVYLVVMVLAFIAAVPMIIISEKKRQLRSVFLKAIAVLTASVLLMFFFHHNLFLLGILLFIFFAAFTLLEASLPSMVSKFSPIKNKGTAMGLYSSSQFFGIFAGGFFGGLVFTHFGYAGNLLFCAIFGVIWLLIAFGMKEPPYLSTIILKPDQSDPQSLKTAAASLNQLNGVAEAAAMHHEGLLYAKIDKQLISEHELRNALEKVNLN